jgi:hypothetical protein
MQTDGIGELHFDVDDAKVYSMAEFGLGVPNDLP